MNLNFKILCSIQLFHQYSKDRTEQGLHLVPDRATMRNFKNLGILCRKTNTGIDVAINVEDDSGGLLVTIPTDDQFRFTFMIQQQDPFFLNRTELALSPSKISNVVEAKSGYYFTNRTVNQFNPDSGFFDNDLNLLSKESNQAVNEKDLISYLPSVFNLAFGSDQVAGQVLVKNADGSPATDPVDFPALKKEQLFQIDLKAKISPGFYLLSIAGGADQPVYISDEVYFQNPFGIIELFNSSITDDDYKLTINNGTQIKKAPDDKLIVTKYALWFASREVHWHYQFNGEQPSAVDKTGASFSKDATYGFVSADKIRLSEAYQLVTIDHNANTINAPNPNPEVIKAKPDDLNYLYAEIYFYL